MISIIIPVLNEASTIETLLDDIYKKGTLQNISQIIVVDGGSKDNTIDLAAAFSEKLPLNILKGRKGRAKQMNVGAQSATGSILYFLHADTILPKNLILKLFMNTKKGTLLVVLE